MQELPVTADGISQWCKDVFVTKVKYYLPKLLDRDSHISAAAWILICNLCCQDAMLEKYFTKNKFSELQCQDIGRPKKSLIVSSKFS